MEIDSNRVKNIDNEIRELLKAGQKDDAKLLLKDGKMIQENLISLEKEWVMTAAKIIRAEGLGVDTWLTVFTKRANSIIQKFQEKQNEQKMDDK